MVRKKLAALAHGWTDDVATRVGQVKLYPDGFGDFDALQECVDRVKAYATASDPAPIDIRWHDPPKTDRLDGSLIRRGEFRSPAAELMPTESASAPVEMRLPRGSRITDRPPIVLLLAATGEQGFMFRRRTSTSPSSTTRRRQATSPPTCRRAR